jgi:hypothetical protein
MKRFCMVIGTLALIVVASGSLDARGVSGGGSRGGFRGGRGGGFSGGRGTARARTRQPGSAQRTQRGRTPGGSGAVPRTQRNGGGVGRGAAAATGSGAGLRVTQTPATFSLSGRQNGGGLGGAAGASVRFERRGTGVNSLLGSGKTNTQLKLNGLNPERSFPDSTSALLHKQIIANAKQNAPKTNTQLKLNNAKADVKSLNATPKSNTQLKLNNLQANLNGKTPPGKGPNRPGTKPQSLKDRQRLKDLLNKLEQALENNSGGGGDSGGSGGGDSGGSGGGDSGGGSGGGDPGDSGGSSGGGAAPSGSGGVAEPVPATSDDGSQDSTSDPVAEQLQDQRFLRVTNDMDQTVTLWVQICTKDDQGGWTWLPDSPEQSSKALMYRLQPGQTTNLGFQGQKLAGNRIRVWARWNGGEWNQYRDQDLWLVPETDAAGNHVYVAPEMETFPLRLAP